ncbi:MAG: cation:proton antiporter [Bacteroidota bacterium]
MTTLLINVNQQQTHHSNMFPLLFIIIALIIGAATRHFLKRSPLPFTVSLLIIGLGLGTANRLGWFGEWDLGMVTLKMDFLHQSLNWAGRIDPHLILYVFLPTLVFEAAFGMDVHTFKKSLTNATLLAVPGIIIALILTAAIIMGMRAGGLGFEGWGWAMALLFGTVVSATDPVAVVALLKELGASKKLGTLIESESLLNDGTAIVIFSVLLLSFTGGEAETGPVMEFLRVAVGGTLVGVLFGWIAIRWVKRVFNDAMIEISVIIAAAYLTFFVAEHFLHVSGVLGLVALGLMMGGIGKTRISPEVKHFLHEFWEIAAFIANTLIFLIVGVVIANDITFTGIDLLKLLILYVGVHVVRAIVIAMLYPIMRRAGYGLPKKDAYVLWYGALRGAIGLALALIVAGEAGIAQEIRDDFLFYTAGLVTLTLLINATTMKYLVNGLGLTRVAPVKALMMAQAKSHLRINAEKTIERLRKERTIKRADWDRVMELLPEKPPPGSSMEMQLKSRVEEARRRVLEIEKSDYWRQFNRGMLGAAAIRRLTDAINVIMDEGGLVSLSDRKDLEQEWRTPRIFGMMQSIPVLGRTARSLFFERLATSYDSALGFVNAQDECLRKVKALRLDADSEGITIDEENLELIEKEINENRIQGHTFIRNLRNYYPEIYGAIATRQAGRALLNDEKQEVKQLLNKGLIDSGEAEKIVSGIEERMKILMDAPPSFDFTGSLEMLKEIPWLRDIDEQVFQRVVAAFRSRVYAVGAQLVREDASDDGMFVIVRGKVKIVINGSVVDVVGTGSVIGEMAVLTGQSRTATVVAVSPVTLLWISTSRLQSIMKMSPELENKLWEFASMRFAMNLLGASEPYSQWHQKEFVQWLLAGELCTPGECGEIDLKERIGILVTGRATTPDGTKTLDAPATLDRSDYQFSKDARVFIRDR